MLLLMLLCLQEGTSSAHWTLIFKSTMTCRTNYLLQLKEMLLMYNLSYWLSFSSIHDDCHYHCRKNIFLPINHVIIWLIISNQAGSLSDLFVPVKSLSVWFNGCSDMQVLPRCLCVCVERLIFIVKLKMGLLYTMYIPKIKSQYTSPGYGFDHGSNRE